MSRSHPALCFLFSVLLHLLVPPAVSAISGWTPPPPEEEEEEAGDPTPSNEEDPPETAPLPDLSASSTAFQVTIFEDPPPPPPEPPPSDTPPIAEPKAPPPTANPEVAILPLPPTLAPETPPPENPIPPEVLEAAREVDKVMEASEAPPEEEEEDGVAEAEVPAGRGGKATAGGHRPRGDKKGKASKLPPCPAEVPEIVKTADRSWAIDRVLVEYYATHMRELTALAWVKTHHDKEGKTDGFVIYPRRCSILKQAGLRREDLVSDVNGIRISTVLEAVRAYFYLRKETEITLRVQRGKEQIILQYHLVEAEEERPRRRRRRERE